GLITNQILAEVQSVPRGQVHIQTEQIRRMRNHARDRRQWRGGGFHLESEAAATHRDGLGKLVVIIHHQDSFGGLGVAPFCQAVSAWFSWKSRKAPRDRV